MWPIVNARRRSRRLWQNAVIAQPGWASLPALRHAHDDMMARDRASDQVYEPLSLRLSFVCAVEMSASRDTLLDAAYDRDTPSGREAAGGAARARPAQGVPDAAARGVRPRGQVDAVRRLDAKRAGESDEQNGDVVPLR
jgi:hypothetical protein